MESNILVDDNFSEQPKRSQYLTVLCILSFIWTGFVLLFLFFCLIFSRALFDVLSHVLDGTSGIPKLNSEQELALQTLLNLGLGTFVSILAGFIILNMTSLLGVFKMWRLQKSGFYIYAIISGLGVFYQIASGSFVMAIISITFIGLYYKNLKEMH